MKDRKKIVKIVTGSRLYGTNRPNSDTDYLGVFLPSTDDMFSLQNPPKEWCEDEKVSTGARNTSDDVDYKSFSLQRYFRLIGEGQPGQLELLFAPEDKIVFSTPEWDEIVARKDLFLSQASIKPFIGFALSQAHKAVVKGENLNRIKALIEYMVSFTPEQLRTPLSSHVTHNTEGAPIYRFGATEIERRTNDFGAVVLVIANRQYDQNIKTKNFLDSLKELESRYGSRTRASAESRIDPKFLMHAYRQLNQAQELLETGHITLPRPQAEIELYKEIRESTYNADFFEELTSKIDHIRQVTQPKSELPKTPDWSKINKLCQNMLRRYLL